MLGLVYTPFGRYQLLSARCLITGCCLISYVTVNTSTHTALQSIIIIGLRSDNADKVVQILNKHIYIVLLYCPLY